MNPNTAIVLVVLVAIGGFALYQYQQAQLAAQRERDPGRLIGAGVGNIVQGVIGFLD